MTGPDPLSDRYPILLAPLRLQTRWTATELLVRAFPDDWAVDAFEPLPTRQEVEAAQRHVVARWLAGRNRGEQLAAWRALAASTGTGRAAWLFTNFPARNPDDEPRKIRAQRILVVAGEERFAPADRAPATTYWTAAWLARDDPDAERAARQALVASVGRDRAEAILARRPAGLDQPPPAAAEDVIVAFLHLSSSDVPTRPASWSTPARARLLPDQLVLLGFDRVGRQVLSQTGAPIPESLVVGLNPALPDDEQLRVVDEALRVPDELRWMVDFDRAVEVGLGWRVPLADPFRTGLHRLVVIGLRTRTAPLDTGRELAGLLLNHFHGPTGLRVVPQGTPTNNTETASSGHDRPDEITEAFTALFRPHPNVPIEMWHLKRADRVLAELLGLDPRTFFPVPGSEATDQAEARAMNLALWPATWGYHLKSTLWPMFSGAQGVASVDALRDFFARYVSGCGAVPAIHIGRQPYGILPTTAFSRLTWPDEPADVAAARRRLHSVLTVATGDWRVFAASVPRVDDDGDPHQTLLDVLGLHPASVEFDQRYVHSVNDYYNRLYLRGDGPRVQSTLTQLDHARVSRLLARLGYDQATDIDLRLVTARHHRLTGPLVEAGPLSEQDTLAPHTADGRNYLQWLADRGRNGLDSMRLESGFTSNRPPRALLYLLLRHALMLGFHETTLRMRSRIPGQEFLLSGGHRESPFVHVTPTALASESTFEPIYAPAPELTGDASAALGEHVQRIIGQDPDTTDLLAQIEAIERLAETPTAALERALVQHLDCCSYRLDAWWLGLAHERLVTQRYRPDFSDYRRGIHVGAYGWLEEVRPNPVAPRRVTLDGELGEVFTPPGADPLFAAAGSDGFLHAPSLDQASTSAILRTGFLSNATPANPATLAVDLSSERVRLARTFLDGLRTGQSLGALFGYQFERGLHDRHGDGLEVDRFIYLLRRFFPLRAKKIPDTVPPEDTDVRLIEARNVVDGLALVRHVTRTGQAGYPFGLPIEADPPATPAQVAAINAEVRRLLDINDALADLAVAEGVHQVVLGNMDRAGAALDGFAKAGATGGPPPADPQVVRTPRGAATLTHRVALHLPEVADPTASPIPGMRMTPRALADPALNAWLAELLPAPEEVGCLVTWHEPDGERVVTQADLGLQPIDLLWTVRPEDRAAMSDLDDRVVGQVPDVPAELRYTAVVPGMTTFFQLSSLLASLRPLVAGRPVRPTDVVPAAGIEPVDPVLDDTVDLPRGRPAAVLDRLRELRAELAAFVADDVSDVDDALRRVAELLGAASGFGLPVSGWSELNGRRRAIHDDLLAAVAAVGQRMVTALGTADAALAEYDVLPGDTDPAERVRRLERIERLLTTEPQSPRPATPDDLRSALDDLRRDFTGKLDDVTAIGPGTLEGLLAAVRNLLPLNRFEPTGLELAPFEERVAAFAADLATRASGAEGECTARVTAAESALATYDTATSGPERATAAIAAIRAMLGEDAPATTEFTVPEAIATQWREVVAAAEQGRLTGHLDREFPVDDWLHGIARVRERMRHWERVTLLADAVARVEPGLTPAQFPYRDGDPWLGLELPSGFSLEEDRLLYAAHYPAPFRPGRTQSAILIDEWTEVLPARQETTGVAVNFDGPGTEPPQSMLLVTPPALTGTWQWDDIVAAVTETLDLTRIRLVEPDRLESTAYAHLLPATGMVATRHPITIATDVAVNNQAVE